MKKILKAPIIFLLALLARGVVRKYRPKIVMVTGSVGKTSTKDAVAAVLAARFLVRKSEKSFNTEFGVPFTIFGSANPWMNPLGWLVVFKNALALLILPSHYPNMLVLEVGAERPGELKKTMRIAIPDALVVTKLPQVPVHVEAYASPEAVREEEFSPAYYLPPAAPLVYLADDSYAAQMSLRVPARAMSYGEQADASLRVSDIGFYIIDGVVAGMRARVQSGDERGEIIVKGSVGKTQILPAAAALALANTFGIALSEAIRALESYEPPPGRGRLFAGKNKSILIDDTYNSSPAALEEALATLRAFPQGKRRIAVLGDMLELGRYSVMEHERLGTLASSSADVIISVGVRARRLAEAAHAAGTPAANLFSYDDFRAAAKALASFVREGDVVLLKGSQSIRTERITAALLADPADSKRLVRQEQEWKKR